MPDPGAVVEYLRGHEADMLAEVEALVRLESPSGDKPALDRCAAEIARRAGATGARVELAADAVQGDHVVATWDGTGRPVVLLGHYDTVWPRGSLRTMPFEVTCGRIRGPGVFDMKVGLVQGLWAVRALHQLGVERPPITLVCNSDEEVGSPGSSELIERVARDALAVLVLEPSLDGRLKTARKGVYRYRLAVGGRSAHAGLDPERGASAVLELCRVALAASELADPGQGTTVNVGTVSGGTAANVVAAHAEAELDVRVATSAEARRVDAAIRALRTATPGTELAVTGGEVAPPMARSRGTAALFAAASGIAAACGYRLEEATAGGGSDGSRCAALGVPVLDGLGAVGGGAHATHEYAEVRGLSERGALVTCLVADAQAALQ